MSREIKIINELKVTDIARNKRRIPNALKLLSKR